MYSIRSVDGLSTNTQHAGCLTFSSEVAAFTNSNLISSPRNWLALCRRSRTQWSSTSQGMQRFWE